jgi:hypothetical protein
MCTDRDAVTRQYFRGLLSLDEAMGRIFKTVNTDGICTQSAFALTQLFLRFIQCDEYLALIDVGTYMLDYVSDGLRNEIRAELIKSVQRKDIIIASLQSKADSGS